MNDDGCCANLPSPATVPTVGLALWAAFLIATEAIVDYLTAPTHMCAHRPAREPARDPVDRWSTE